MYGFKPTTQRGAENSGMVRGPGTGTSDSVKAAVLPGTYIMPAARHRAAGPSRTRCGRGGAEARVTLRAVTAGVTAKRG